MIFMFEPGTAQEGERNCRLLRQGRFKLDMFARHGVKHEIAESAAFREHPEELEAGTVAHEANLGDTSLIVHESSITPEAGLRDFRHCRCKAVKIIISYCEIGVEAVMWQDGAFASPAQQESAPDPVMTSEAGALQDIVQIA